MGLAVRRKRERSARPETFRLAVTGGTPQRILGDSFSDSRKI